MRACVFYRDWTVRKKTGSVGLTSGNEEKKIDLPYDAMICEARSADAVGSFRTGYFPNGVWEFKKSFFVPEDAAAQKLVFRFDGVYAHSCVYINGDYAGGHTYGYSQFFVDTDGLLKYGQDNELTVIARSVDDARWYSGCGIYRDVYLLTASRICIPPARLVISTPEIGVDETRACVTIPVKNGEALQKTVRVEATIYDQAGNSVSRGSAPLTITGGESATAYLNLYMTEPKLWDLDAPYLYQCRVTVTGPDGEVLDEETAAFGLRSIFVSPSKGFQLNGKTVKLRGACIHHDNGPLGVVSTAFVEERRIHRLKGAGFNAIRCAHNPAGQALLDACDKLGMLVMNEVFDAWTRPKVNFDYSMDFAHHWQEDVDAFVRSSVNHPSVVIYSIGNEIPETGSPNGARFGRAIAQRIKSLDPSRPTLNSINGMMSVMSILESLRDSPSEEQRGGEINQQMSDLREVMSQVMNLDVITHATEEAYACVDIAGYNYMDVRYEQDHTRFPNRVICGTETYPPRIAQNWALIKKCSHVIGDFTWTGWDYIGEAGIGLVKCTQPPAEYGVSAPYPSLTAYCGDLTICGERRPVSFYREIVFGLRKEPYIAVIRPESMGVPTVTTPWSWSDSVSSWSFAGFEGRALKVEVYTDAGEVALYLNGELIGQEKTIACKAEFSVPYRSGELTAAAVRDGIEKERFSLRSAAGERRLILRPEAPAASVGEYAYVRLSLEDENGNLFTGDRPRVQVSVTGAACLAAFGNDDPLTEENFFDSARTLYDGTALVILRPVTVGRIQLRAEADGLCAESEIDVVEEENTK